jgi:hypothetical protein
MSIQIVSAIGDTPTRSIPMVVDVDGDQTAFEPASAWNLVLSAKTQLSEADQASQFQLMSGAGITAADSDALCVVARDATVNLGPGNLYFDIRATHLVTGESHIVARGRWQLVRPSTRLAMPSMMIYSITPFAGYVGGGDQDSFATAENPDGGLDLTLYNYTTGTYRRVFITGSGASERIAFGNL